MRVPKIAIAAMALLLASGSQVHAQTTLDFEGVPGGTFSSYGGFSFTGGRGIDSWVSGTISSYGFHSPDNGAWSNGGTYLEFSRGATFTFNSIYLSAANGGCGGGVDVLQTIRGFNGTEAVKHQTSRVSCSGMQLVTFDWADVDRIRFDEVSPYAINLQLDDLTYDGPVNPSVTPEPVSMTLLATGLAGIAAARRRRRNPSGTPSK